MQRRISKVLDPQLQDTQYGFRANRGTAEALHCVRRAIEVGEITRDPVLLTLLDWEKAFDKVDQRSISESLKRMGVDGKLIRLKQRIVRPP